MSLVYEVAATPHQCISGLGGASACQNPAHYHVGSKNSWRRRHKGRGIFYFTCQTHLPATATLRGAPKAWKVAIGDRVIDVVHSRYSSAILAAQVLRGLGSRKVTVKRA